MLMRALIDFTPLTKSPAKAGEPFQSRFSIT